MPLYEFRCDTCSHQFEDLIPAGATARCPVCGNQSPTRLLSTFAAHGGKECGSADDCCGGGGCGEGGGCDAGASGAALGGCGCGGGGCGCH